MSIDTLKIVIITSDLVQAGSNMIVGLTVDVAGETVASSETVGAGERGSVRTTTMALRYPVEPNNVNLNGFNLYIENGGDPTDAWLPAAIYIYGGLDGVATQLLAGISQWPQALWFSAEASDHVGPDAATVYNLGVVASV